MKKTIMFENEKYHFVGVFGNGFYYESDDRFLFTGPKSDIEFRVPKRDNPVNFQYAEENA